MKIDKTDVIAFVLGIATSIVANMIWEKYKERQKQLAYGEKKIISELHSAFEGLKQHINQKV